MALWDIDQTAVNALAENIKHRGTPCFGLGLDVSNANQVDAAMQRSVELLGTVDGAFNNAGVGAPTAPFDTLGEADFDRVMAVNLKGVWLCMRAQFQHMRTSGGGSIVNNASVSGLVALAGQAAYTATKHGVVGLSKAAAVGGATISWASAGTMGFKGARKSTPFAAGRAADKAAGEAKKSGMLEVDVRVKGPGAGREQAILNLQHAGLKVATIEDTSPLPHNGCRPPKKRRV